MRKIAGLCLGLLLCAVSILGQNLSSLSGTVTDSSGSSIARATIELRNNDTKAVRTTISSDTGSYTFQQVPPGTYTATASAPGFSTTTVKDIHLLVNSPTSINILLEVGSLNQTVEVSAQSVQINNQDASLGNAISSEVIKEMPLFARNVAGLLAFQPGVTSISSDEKDYRNGAVNGGKGDQANVTLDGVDVNDQQNRYAFTSVLRVTPDSVQEFRTTTHNATADQGRSSGAQIALVTKGGTNNLHGSAYEYHRNTITAANDYFNNLAGVKQGALLINVFGASVGGPIKKNKAFFFVNYEGRRDASASNIVRTVPSDTLRRGTVQYRTKDGVIKQLDAPTIKRDIDPLHIGPNAASLDLFSKYPVGNDSTVGDSLNSRGFRFTAPQRSKQDTYIARLDYNIGSAGRHSLFWRGNLQNDHSSGVPQFPGDPPSSVGLTNSKGIAVGWTALFGTKYVNTLRYGFTRQGVELTGIQTRPATTFRGLTPRNALTRGISRIIPVHNISEDGAWTRGNHDVRFGTVFRWTTAGTTNFDHSFNSATTNVSWLRGTGKDIQPGDLDPKFRTAYGDAMMAVLGIVSQGNGNYNYDIKGNVLPAGAPVKRKFASEEYELYVQDTWKITRALTVTAGLRYSLMPPVYEANGVQISSTQSLGEWFSKRGTLAANGRPQTEAGRITYVLASDPQGRPLYPYHKKNFAPRLALAYSPQWNDGLLRRLTGGPQKTVIRAGAGVFYDLFGQPLIRTFDATAFGLSTTLVNPSGTITSSTAPRFTGFYDVPSALVRPAPKGGFPADQPNNLAITNSIDDTIKPPYSIALDLSVGREFGNGFFVQAAYVGRLSRRALINRDLAMPTNLKDPVSGMTYFEAAKQLALLDKKNTPWQKVAPIPYWENLWPGAAGKGMTATQRLYRVFGSDEDFGYAPDYTSALFDIDTKTCDPSCSRFGPFAIFSSQFSALSAWSSVGRGDYHGMQWTVRKRFSHGLLFDFNYTWSKSTDFASAPERSAAFSGFMLNPWFPNQRKGVSDYDATHIFNAFAFWEVPVGRNKRVGSNFNGLLDAVLGGWQIAPSWSQTTGLPVSVGNGRNWPTNWNITGFATPSGPVPEARTSKKGAVPNLFASPGAYKAFDFTLPGETGQRNGLRGDGSFVINLGVYKRFIMPYKESHSIQFRWETFNLTNTPRFDVNSLTLDLGNTTSFGKYSATLSTARQMQFALRYEF